MHKIELLAPAGNLEKAKIALLYGADAVYVGGKSFSLRARASNFDIPDIEELCSYAHGLGKKVYVTTNIIPHDEDLDGLDEYLKNLEKAGVNGIITSSLYIITEAKRVAPLLERHVSTQTSITNSSVIDYYKQFDIKRVVLAREDTLEEIEYIKNHTDIELEVFIHGGMCASYSGRCMLSNYMTDRDANRGGCAHSCRWNYTLYNKDERVNPADSWFNIGSKDLMAIRFIPRLMDIGVASLKIEGRMKSSYYLATVVGTYRKVIDLYNEKGSITEEEFTYFENEIAKAENRLTSIGFYNGPTTINEQLYDMRSEEPTKEYVAFILDYNEETHQALIEQRNYFAPGDLLEVFGPTINDERFTCGKLIDKETLEELEVARHPLQQIYMEIPFTVHKNDMIRIVKNKTCK